MYINVKGFPTFLSLLHLYIYLTCLRVRGIQVNVYHNSFSCLIIKWIPFHNWTCCILLVPCSLQIQIRIAITVSSLLGKDSSLDLRNKRVNPIYAPLPTMDYISYFVCLYILFTSVLCCSKNLGKMSLSPLLLAFPS